MVKKVKEPTPLEGKAAKKLSETLGSEQGGVNSE